MMKIFLPEPIRFEWDKGNQNKSWQKHKVSTKECEEAFQDPRRRLWKDSPHSKNEPRYIMLAAAQNERILFIVFTIRTKSVRVISARSASKNERKIYL